METELYELDDVSLNWLVDESDDYWRYFVGPHLIFGHLLPFIITVTTARILHLFSDLTNLRFRSFKTITIILSGIWQLHVFLKQSDISNVQNFYLILFISFAISYFFQVKSSKMTRVFYCNGPSGIILRILFTPVFLNEIVNLYFKDASCLRYRSVFMTLTMKQIALELDRERIFNQFPHYLHPASCLFGPWHPIIGHSERESTCCQIVTTFISQLKNALLSLSQAFLLVFISSNLDEFSTFIFPLYQGIPLVESILYIYFRALEFRLSHYFTCILAQSFLSLWNKPESKKLKLVEITKIEWPRSLVEVVINWNINMHIWLKNYIFKPLNRQTNLGILSIVLITYLISSSLHGFKFHIWAVLFSLGFFTWTEHTLRSKLAKKLSACILTKTCNYSSDGRCMKKHIKTPANSYEVQLINFCFRLLAIVLLAYLGYIFTGDTDVAGYKDALLSWSELNFFGHILTLAIYLISVAV